MDDDPMNLSGSRFDVLRFFGEVYPMKMIAGTEKVSVSMVWRLGKVFGMFTVSVFFKRGRNDGYTSSDCRSYV